MTFIEKFNEQVNFELESAYIYRTMAIYMADQDLDGFEAFFDAQVREEVMHADDFKNTLLRVGETVKYRPIDPGNGEFESVLDVFEKALAHEKLVTAKIRELYEESFNEENKYFSVFLQKYLDEQVEEEETFGKIVRQLQRLDGYWAGIYQMNSYIGNRPE